MSENHQDGQETLQSISALPDFAQIYSFLQYFGKLLFLPNITIYELENFFKEGYLMLENPVTFVQWRLLNNVCKKQPQTEWQRMAVKFGRRRSVLSQTVPYGEVPVQKRVKIFRLSCEEQFDSNAHFKLELKKTVPPEDMQVRPLGADRRGTRHWIIRDSVFDFRLFGESGYNEPPPKLATWEELARSPNDLALYIATIESRWTTVNALSQRDEQPPSVDVRNYADPQNPSMCHTPGALPSSKGSTTSGAGVTFQPKGVGKKPKPKRSKKLAKETEAEGGCLKCHKDVHYKQMLLCDGCDKECHTYCQYPVLWDIPKGKWLCPLCKEKLLLEKLRAIHSELSQGRTNRERAMERKQRSVARLQRSGLLLQNIIMEDDTGLDSRRSRRSRKEVNYAELNDVYLPPLGPSDYIRSDEAGRNTRSVRFVDEKRASVHAMCGTRYSKRMRGVSPADEDGESEGEVDDDMECEDTQLMEPRMMYSTDSDSNTDKEEKLSWNEDSESGSETENRVRTSHAESYTWATVASEPSSDNTSPVDNRDRDRFFSNDQCSSSSVGLHPADFSSERTCDPPGSSWCCEGSFLPQKAAESREAL